MARRSRRNRRRSRGRFAFLYRLLCFVLICAAIVGALVLFFKVDTISVSGNDRYSRETILAASGVSEGDNLFLLNKYDAAAKITEALPYVESVRLSRKLPGTLRIDIVECSDPAGIQQDGHCWLISPEGKLVDSPAEAPNGCPMVVGLSLTDPQVGSLAAVPEEQSGDLARLLELLRQLVEAAGSDVEILVGAGVSAGNLPALAAQTGARAFHLSGKQVLDSRMTFRREGVPMGLPGFSEFELWQTSETNIRAARKALDAL